MVNTQKGFSLVEGLLILIVVGIIGFGGYYAWSQNKDESSSEVSTSTPDETNLDSTSQAPEVVEITALTVDSAVSQIDREFVALSEGNYKYEKLAGSEQTIKISNDTNQDISISESNNIYYRTDAVGSGFEEYEAYKSSMQQTASKIDEFINSTLNLTSIYSYEETTPSGYVFMNNVYEINGRYLQTTTSETGLHIAWLLIYEIL